jgi:hypothetical protein
MPKTTIYCPDCNTKSTIAAQGASPVQCCPFCGNTLLPAEDEEDQPEEDEDDD